MKNPIQQKQAIMIRIRYSLHRSPCRHCIFLIPLVLAWCALSPNAAAQSRVNTEELKKPTTQSRVITEKPNKPTTQSRVITEKPKKPTIKLIVPDLWCPTGTVCKFYNMPNYNTTTGILTVAVGNQGSASSPSCSLRVSESRAEEGSGPFTPYKNYLKTVPALTPGQQVAIPVQVIKWSGGFTDGKKPIKHPRRWFIMADADHQVLEVNETNNGTTCYTYN
jgi:CARDB